MRPSEDHTMNDLFATTPPVEKIEGGGVGGQDIKGKAPESADVEPIRPYADADDGDGLRWSVLDVIARAPTRLVPQIVRAIVKLRRTKGLTTTIDLLAANLGTTPAVIASCIEHAPQVLVATRKGQWIALRADKPKPWDLDPAALAALDKAAEKERKRAERRAAQDVKDAVDNEFNTMRLQLEAMGLTRDEARTFGWTMVRSYTFPATAAAVKTAVEKKPGDPKSYIIAILKRQLAAGDGASTSGARPRTVSMIQRPDGSGRTTFLGWEDREIDGVRHKLFRQPTGILKRQPPEVGETAPGFTEDAGWRVAN